jgi:hypothetical protein
LHLPDIQMLSPFPAFIAGFGHRCLETGGKGFSLDKVDDPETFFGMNHLVYSIVQ